jgi:hypothetical protein
MTDVDVDTLTAVDTEGIGPTAAPAGTTAPFRRRLALIGGAVIVLVVGSLWYGLSRTSGPTINTTLADCSNAAVNQNNGLPETGWRPIVVGLGTVASMAVFDTPTGPAWCYDGMGTGGGGFSPATLRAAVGVPIAVVDGGLDADVLMLVHLGRSTASVVVTTATSHSIVLAHGGGFEVLRVPMASWPHWHAPWSRHAVALGQIVGFDREGRVTSSQVFSWCPGGINRFIGTAC